jgi:hypothetical protein
LILGLAFGGSVTALVMRMSFQGHAARNLAVQRSDAAFRRVATDLGLTFAEGSSESYALIGKIRSFGRLRGHVHGVEVRVNVGFDSPGSGTVHFHTEITAELSARAGRFDANAIRDIDASFEDADVELDEGRLKLTVRERGSAALGMYTFGLLDDPERLREVIDRLASIAAEGRSVYRA